MKKLSGVIGWPISHSRSPAMHNAAYAVAGIDAVYLPFAVEPSGLAAALSGLKALGMLGVNITVPHKQPALVCCDDLDDVAERVGAVNTIVPRGRWMHGANTDVEGFALGLRDAHGDPARTVLLGAGGAARSVLMALEPHGVRPTVVARDPDRGANLDAKVVPWTEDALAGACDGATLLVDTTSAALSPEAELELPAPVPLDRLDRKALVTSLVYHREPALLLAARAIGLRTQDGGPMLVYQAAAAFTLMTGAAAPLDVMRAAFLAAEKANAPTGSPHGASAKPYANDEN